MFKSVRFSNMRVLFAAILVLPLTFVQNAAFAADGEAIQGKLVFWRTSQIASPVTGRVQGLPKRVGDGVQKGEVIAIIDTQQLEADLDAGPGLASVTRGILFLRLIGKR